MLLIRDRIWKWQLLLLMLPLALAFAVACGGDDDEVATAVSVAPTTQVAPTTAPATVPDIVAGEVRDVPRDRTLRLIWGGSGGVGTAGRYTDDSLWNPYNPGTSHQNGSQLFYEPLAYYSAFADEIIPWLAEDWSYNGDSTELTINLREGVTWSDGEEFNADDVVYTLETLRELGAEVKWGSNVAATVSSTVKVDDFTVKMNFTVPQPKFMHFMTYKYDIGVHMVPEHIFRGQDWPAFNNFDIDKGWPISTSPWQVVASSPEQKVIDRRNSWWAVDQGLVDALPEVERIIYIPNPGETQMAAAFINNEVDASLDLRPSTMKEVLAQNSKITTHSGDQPPFGYIDWWPISLFFNDDKAPFDDPDVRWAMSYFIDRDQLIEVGYEGAGTLYPLPLPDGAAYAGLARYKTVIDDLLADLNPIEFSLDKGTARMETAGYTKDSSGIWRDANGDSITCDIIGFGIFNDFGPVLSEQLKKAGIEASYSTPPDVGDRQASGDFTCALRGHGGSVRDPYATMQLYQSTSQLVPGGHLVNIYSWSDGEFDALADEVGQTPIDDTDTLETLWRSAMETWLPQLPDVQLLSWYHRIPMNREFWTGWPTAEDPYVNGAFWHMTFPLILDNLKAVK
ncbi:MAG: ABC transporter substrate-binding protein [Chloroflexi bacterium]|nr:ABC transporter substrate-binding protein [Chloroflexota bacterium]